MDGRELEDGEVCVKMLAAPINPSDINRIEGSSLMNVGDLAAVMVNFKLLPVYLRLFCYLLLPIFLVADLHHNFFLIEI